MSKYPKSIYSNSGSDYLKLSFIEKYPFVSEVTYLDDDVDILYEKTENYDNEIDMWRYDLVKRKRK